MRFLSVLSFLFLIFALWADAVPPVLNYAGQVAVNGEAFEGNGLFKFALVDTDGKATYWSNDGTSVGGSEPQVAVRVSVRGGLYSILLGSTAIQGMNALDPAIFQQHSDSRLRVWFSDGVNGFQQLSPDRPFASVPYAFSAQSANSADMANTALAVENGAITKSMLSQAILNDLNRTITKGMLSQDIKDDLNRTIGVSQLSSEVRADLNRTITKSMLSQEVLNELNSSSGGGGVVPGSLLAIPRNQSAPSGYELYQKGERKDLVWEEKAPVSVARYAGDGVEVLGGKIYFVGGWNNSGAKNIAERYDPTTNTWETLANMSAARAGVACAVLEGKLYAIGGQGLSSVEKFDPSTDSWSVGITLPNEVNRGNAITVNGKTYLIGGWNSSNQPINQVLCFEPSTSEWTTKANIPTARHSMKLVWFENRIWAIGGATVGGATNKVESYNPSTDTWQAEASLTTIRLWPIAWVTDGTIYVGGGRHGSDSDLNSIEVYDPTTEYWTNTGNFPENKFVADAVVLNDRVYVVAGHNGGTYSSKVFAADLNASMSGVFDLYRKDGNASSGVPVAQVADGSITTTQLSEQILKYLKPEITTQPQAQTVFADTDASFSVSAEGKYLTYQWKKNGTALAGETNATLTITDANATQHDGNYTVVVSNDFGSVESGQADMDVWNVGDDVSNVSLWLDASNFGSFELSSSVIQNWRDLSGNGNDMNIPYGNPSLTGQLNGKTVASYDGDDTTATTKNFSNDLDQSGYSIVALSRYAGNPKFRVISSGFSGGSRNWLLGHHDGKHSTFFAENWVDPGTTGDLNWHIFSVTHEPAISHNNGAAPLSSFWLDGTNRVQNSGLSSDSAPSPSDIVFGGALTTERSNCEVAEFIMIAAEISDTKRQEIEGYLAHKWGLRSILPNNHSYK